MVLPDFCTYNAKLFCCVVCVEPCCVIGTADGAWNEALRINFQKNVNKFNLKSGCKKKFCTYGPKPLGCVICPCTEGIAGGGNGALKKNP